MIVQSLKDGKIIHFQFDAGVLLCKTMLRFQEHYESPQFAKKIFTLGMYRAWYTIKYGAFTYYTDWVGFNFPHTAVKPFLDGLFDPLTNEEQYVVDVLRHVATPYYVIGSKDDDAFEHEMTHAMYYIIDEYREAVNKMLSTNNLDHLKEHLLKHYSEDVLLDECNAYLCDVDEYLKDNGIKIPKYIKKKLLKLKRQNE